MHFSNKAHVPLSRTTQNLHIIRNRGILRTSNTKENRKRFLQNRIPAPKIMPELQELDRSFDEVDSKLLLYVVCLSPDAAFNKEINSACSLLS